MPRIVFGVTIPMTAQAFLLDQMVDLHDAGWDVHLVTSPVDGFEGLLTIPGITVHALPMKRPPAPLLDLQSLGKWMRLLRRIEPDVLVASTPKAGLLGMLAAWVTRVPARIYHIRGLRAEGLHGLTKRLSLVSETIAIRCSTSVLCDSDSLMSRLLEVGALKRHRGTVLGGGSCCGVDTGHFRPPSRVERDAARAALRLPGHAVVIGFVGRIVSDKGITELLAATTALRSANPSVTLVLVGPHEEPDLQLPPPSDGIIAVGTAHDVRGYYWAFDIFCLPSHREGFPISLLEAQACGLPVVTTAATGCVDAIVDNKTGVICPVGDKQALSSALDSFIKDASKRLIFGRAAQSWVAENFDACLVRARVIEFFRQESSEQSQVKGGQRR